MGRGPNHDTAGVLVELKLRRNVNPRPPPGHTICVTAALKYAASVRVSLAFLKLLEIMLYHIYITLYTLRSSYADTYVLRVYTNRTKKYTP